MEYVIAILVVLSSIVSFSICLFIVYKIQDMRHSKMYKKEEADHISARLLIEAYEHMFSKFVENKWTPKEQGSSVLWMYASYLKKENEYRYNNLIKQYPFLKEVEEHNSK